MFGRDPDGVVLPGKVVGLVEEWAQQSVTFALAITGSRVDNHYPPHPVFATNLTLKERCIQVCEPIIGAITVFTDASGRTGKYGFAIQNSQGNWETVIRQEPNWLIQVLELKVVWLAFQAHRHLPLNLVVDSLYVASVIQRLEDALIGRPNNEAVRACTILIKNEIESRRDPFWCIHVRSHITLPGVFTEGNGVIDRAVAAVASHGAKAEPLRAAASSHAFFDQSARALQREFDLPRAQARAMVAACPDCGRVSPIQTQGVNPRGLQSRVIWQTDVTDIPSFGPQKHVHVSVDTCSTMVWVTAANSTNWSATKRHWLSAFAVMGCPSQIKTDIGPAYRSKACCNFLSQWGICHVTGIPHNSTGQAIVERRHQDLKCLVSTLKRRGRNPHRTFWPKLAMC